MVIVLIQEKNHVFIILINDKNRYISPMAATVGKGTLDVQKKKMDICQSIVSWIRKYIKLIDKCFTFGFFLVPDYIYTKIMKCQDFNDTSDKNIDLTFLKE